MFKKILVCVDGSECGDRAARAAADIAFKFSAEVVLLHVSHSGAQVAPFTMDADAVPNIGGIQEYAQQVQQTVLANASHLFEQDGISIKMRAESGQLVAVVTRTAEEESADLTVVGSDGTSGLKRLIFGSVSESIMRHVNCPVMIVR